MEQRESTVQTMTNPTSPIPLLPGLALHGAVLALLRGGQPATMQIGSAWMNLLLTVDAHLQTQQCANIAQTELDLVPVAGEAATGQGAGEEGADLADVLAGNDPDIDDALAELVPPKPMGPAETLLLSGCLDNPEVDECDSVRV